MTKVLLFFLFLFLIENSPAAAPSFSASNCAQKNHDAEDLASFLMAVQNAKEASKSHKTIAELLLRSLRGSLSGKASDNTGIIPDNFVLICSDQGNIAAVANYFLNNVRYRNYLFLDYLLAVPKGFLLNGSETYQGGAGTAAIRYLARLAIDATKHGIAIEPIRSAVSFYKQLGFKRIPATQKNEEYYLLDMENIEKLLNIPRG